jgi:hypothetical protein
MLTLAVSKLLLAAIGYQIMYIHDLILEIELVWCKLIMSQL